MTLLYVYFFAAITVSFFCSLLEAVLLSVTPAHVALLVKQGHRIGYILKDLKSQIDRPLAAILTINTVANTVGAAGVGAQVLKVYGNDAVALASGLLTLSILIFSEILPKTIGASRWQLLAPTAAVAIRILMIVAFPLVVLSEKISLLLGQARPTKLNREEILATAELGESEGALRRKETRVIRNLLMLNNIFVVDIMTPRNVAFALPEEKTVGNLLSEHTQLQFSRIPIYRGSMDHIIGFVHRYKVLEASWRNEENMALGNLVSPIQAINENTSVAKALDMFIKQKAHIFYVVDNFTVTTGIVTLEDTIETLLGVEIVDEFDSVADMRQFALEQWQRLKQERGSHP